MIVAICGYQQAGKTTVASQFERHGYARRPLADPIKNMLRVGFGLTPAQLYGDEKDIPCAALGGRSPRYAMQTLGTDWGRRMMGQHTWTHAWNNTAPMDRNIVVDDLRFPNEALELIALGAYFVRVERDGTAPVGLPHASELYADQFPVDLVIQNNGTIQHLTDTVEDFLTDLENVPRGGAPRIADFRTILAELIVEGVP